MAEYETEQPKATLLVVDDTRLSLCFLSRMLTREGYQVRAERDARVALSSALEERYDLILLDIVMPDMSGYDVCGHLKADARTRDIPVIFISSLDEVVDKVKAFSIGGVDYITKPFQTEEVLARVKTHLALRRLQEHLEMKNTWLQTEINERKQAEKALKQTQEELREAKAAAEAANYAKSAFLANMSHELRTPLNAILGFTQIMARAQHLNPEHKENLDIISQSGEHLLTLINDVLDMSKIEAGRISLREQNFDLFRLLDEMEDMFRLQAEEKDLQLIFERAPDVCQYVRTDETRLRQVLINLLNNAVKFTKEGGISLRVRSERAKQASENPETAETLPERPRDQADILCFELEDTGPGIVPDELDTLFEAFIQTKTGRESREGSGLGLPISQKFVQMMGGDMIVTSEPNRGTVFKFDIRVTRAEAADVRIKGTDRRIIALEPGQPCYRILIVDNRQSNRRLLLKLLSPFGFELQEACNGQEAIDAWKAWEPHLIWMDMRMPIMDGYEAARQIKSTTKGQATAVIALTASTFEEEREVFLSAGCDDFLRKPFREGDIFGMMEKHLGVRYVYEDPLEDERQRTTDGRRLGQSLNALADLPSELLERLEQATIRANMNQISEMINDIRARDDALANALKRLADDFEYSKILAAIQIRSSRTSGMEQE